MNETEVVLVQVGAERRRQDEKWGEQNWPNGTGPRKVCRGRLEFLEETARKAKLRTDVNAKTGYLTYRDILEEEFYEALAEEDPRALRAELIQTAAVAVAWVEKIDREAQR